MSRRRRRKETPDEIVQRLTSPKMIAIYGHYETRVNVLERILKTRIDGVKQHYWVKTGKTGIMTLSGRFEFYGSGKDLERSVLATRNIVPKERHQIVPAREFLSNPYKYGKSGYWIDKEISS